ncbi:MAG: hypothetical protein IPJ77_20690 [Planctomycetes bacterium]|nr:hypothetical protein [Planctomycetota bacterium]
MNRHQLEHVVGAAARIADDDEIVVIGSQAILGQFPEAPPELCVSREADLYPRRHPERADLIDGSIGEGSPFDQTFGYYAQGVSPSTAVLPRGWDERLVPVRGGALRGATAWCLEVHDLLVSKLVAGRSKDLEFARCVFAHRLADPAITRERLAGTELDAGLRRETAVRIERALANEG